MTQQLDLLPDVPQPTRRFPQEPIARSADIERVGRSATYRWTARRAWQPSWPVILWCMLNPSIADGKVDDPTMRKIIGYSFRWGYGSAIIENIYPFVSPDPVKMFRWRKRFDHKFYEGMGMRPWDIDKSPYSAFMHNIGNISKLITDGMTCVAAWGNEADEGDVEFFLHNVNFKCDTSEHDGFGVIDIPITWRCLGKNGNGSPKHPLYLKNDAKLEIWRKGADRNG